MSDERLTVMEMEDNKLASITQLLGFGIDRILQSCTLDLRCSTEFHGPTLNRKLKGTKYFANTSKFLHFTSLKALFSMINEKSIRLYSLSNSSDPMEYGFMGDEIRKIYQIMGYPEKYYSEYINNVKNQYFILSATSVDNIKSEKHWQEYGNHSKGVAVEFEIMNEPEFWDGFHFSPVHYGKPENWDSFISQLIDLQNKNPSHRYRIFFDQFYCLHKKPVKTYIDEQELRLLAHRPGWYGFGFDTLIQNDVGKDGLSQVQYLKLPLYCMDKNKLSFNNLLTDYNNYRCSTNLITEDDVLSFLQNSPKIKLSKVHFFSEDSFPGKNFKEMIDSICEKAYFNLGYSLSVEFVN